MKATMTMTMTPTVRLGRTLVRTPCDYDSKKRKKLALVVVAASV